jgi:hypothetical protein
MPKKDADAQPSGDAQPTYLIYLRALFPLTRFAFGCDG